MPLTHAPTSLVCLVQFTTVVLYTPVLLEAYPALLDAAASWALGAGLGGGWPREQLVLR